MVGKGLVMQAPGPEFDSWNPYEKAVSWKVISPSIREVETDASLAS